MSGHFEPAIRQLFTLHNTDSVLKVEERDGNNVRIELSFMHNKILSLKDLNTLAELLGTGIIDIKVEPDNRYADQGDYNVTIIIVAHGVLFPEPAKLPGAP